VYLYRPTREGDFLQELLTGQLHHDRGIVQAGLIGVKGNWYAWFVAGS
jgi:hypothetical protein